jgi:hypothetical protein
MLFNPSSCSPLRMTPWLVVIACLVLASCGQGEESLDPGPGQPDEATSTGAPTTDDTRDDVETAEPAPTTSVVTSGVDGTTSTTVVINQESENAQEYTELAASGLVLTLAEQACADEAITREVDDGTERLDGVIVAVQECASPKAVDDFASILISAGGAPLPATEAACVAGQLRADDAYRPFWSALFAEEPFDFLAAETEVQNQYLDLFATCVSVGRALSDQVAVDLSFSSIDCINSLYADREFVRISIEADLSGDPDELARINQQIGTCLTTDERAALDL